jgi:glycoprotein-N-acetylgalactosamine 3-beta-galactosyltransferase
VLINSARARELHGEVRVLCIVHTMDKSRTRRDAVNATWVPRCNGHLFTMATKQSAPDILAFKNQSTETTNDLMLKTVTEIKYVYEHYLNDFDWFFKADDDTYVVMENLRYLLSHYDASKPAYIGFLFKLFVEQGYMSGGAGFVLSRAGLRDLVEKGLPHPNCTTDGPNNKDDDVEIGKCIQLAGIPVYSSLDKFGRETFHGGTEVEHIVNPPKVSHRLWSRNEQYFVSHLSLFLYSFALFLIIPVLLSCLRSLPQMTYMCRRDVNTISSSSLYLTY